MKPHDDFRLWLTAEVHPKFPTILLQSSLKITYEVILKKLIKGKTQSLIVKVNLQRSNFTILILIRLMENFALLICVSTCRVTNEET